MRADEPYSWRIDRIPGKPVRRERRDGGRVVLPLWLLRDGKFFADLDLNLSRGEAEQLHAQLSRALIAEPSPAHARTSADEAAAARGVER